MSQEGSSRVFSEKTLADFCLDIWQARYFVLSGVLITALLAGAFLINAIPHYKAQMMISPARPMSGFESASVLKDENFLALRSLAQHAGLSDSAEFTRFEHIYSGPSIAAKLLNDPVIIKGLELDRSFRKFGKTSGVHEWSAVQLADYISRRVRLEPVKASALRRMVYLHSSPEFGVYFVQQIHALSDLHIRTDIRGTAKKRILYLQKTMAETRNPDHRRALTTLLMEQERLRMLSSIDQAYAAEIIEPASSFFKPSWPQVPLIFMAFIMSGALVGFFAYGALSGLSSLRKARAQSKNEPMDVEWYNRNSGNSNKRPLTKPSVVPPSSDISK